MQERQSLKKKKKKKKRQSVTVVTAVHRVSQPTITKSEVSGPALHVQIVANNVERQQTNKNQQQLDNTLR